MGLPSRFRLPGEIFCVISLPQTTAGAVNVNALPLLVPSQRKNPMSEKLTKKEVCALLHIGYSTLGRWMREGKIKFQRDTTAGKFEPAVFFKRDDLAAFLPPSSVLGTEHPPAPAPQQPKPTPAPKESRDIRSWAEKYKDGDEPDSCGNYRDGYNPRWPETGASLLGPVIPRDVPPINRDTTSHMNPHLVGRTDGPSGNDVYLNSTEFSDLLHGRGSITAAEFQSKATKTRPISQQQRKQQVDINVIRNAFKLGFSR
jgi:hypothetical protein